MESQISDVVTDRRIGQAGPDVGVRVRQVVADDVTRTSVPIGHIVRVPTHIHERKTPSGTT